MKFFTNLFIITITIVALFSFLSPKQAYAFIPDIDGYVKVAGTNAPIPGVWVRMRDNKQCGEYQYRYALTDKNGHYVFLGWTQDGVKGDGVMIDTNLDGSKDAEMHPSTDLCDPGETAGSAFSCGRDPFQMTVVRPYNWAGTFDSIGGEYKGNGNACESYCINNGVIAADVPPIYYHGNVAPTTTPNPTLKPSAVPPPATPTSCPVTVAQLAPTDDKEVNIGSALEAAEPITWLDELEVEGDPTDVSNTFFKFDLTPYASRIITSATLHWYVNGNTDASRSAAAVFSLKDVPTTTWNESSLNWSNQPLMGAAVTAGVGGTRDTWVDLNVTSYVSSKKGSIVSLGVDTTNASGSGMHINSKEDVVNRPYLEVSSTCAIALPTPTLLPSPTPVASSITAIIYEDLNGNGIKDGGEPNYTKSDLSISISGPQTASKTIGSSGTYTFSNLLLGNYTVTLLTPSNNKVTTKNPENINLKAIGENVTFGISTGFVITGNVFDDINKNRFKDSDESNYAGKITITSSQGSVVTTTSGKFTVSDLPAGTYTVSYSTLPAGYQVVYPKVGPPASFTVTVGAACTADATTGAYCNSNNDVINLNFAITNSIPWTQGVGMDMRFDNGYTNYVPPAPSCGVGSYAAIPGSSSTPGIIFTGSSQPNFGIGQSSTTDWVVGGAAYPENYTGSKNALVTSYNSLLSSIKTKGQTVLDLQTLSGCADLNNCTLPNSLSSGIYRANGSVVLNGYTFPANKNIIILVNGSLTVRGGIFVPTDSVVLFSAAQDITIDKNVGSPMVCNTTTDLVEGIYSADRDFIVDGYNDCVTHGSDKLLRMNGSIILNAALKGGSFENNRDLCQNNLDYPTITFDERLDFVLNLPDVLRQNNFIYQEVAP